MDEMSPQEVESKFMANSQAKLKHECGLFHLRRAYRVAGKLYSDVLDHADLDSSHFGILTTIAKNGPLSISDLANRVGLDRTTMSRNLKPLEQKRLVKIANASKGRARFIEITASGERVIKEALPHWRKAQKDFRTLIGDKDMNELINILDRVYHAVNER